MPRITVPSGRELSTEGDSSCSRDQCAPLIKLFVCYGDVAATTAHDPRTALRYYDVLSTSSANKRLSGFASLDQHRDWLERPAEESGSDSDLVPDSRPFSPAALPARPPAIAASSPSSEPPSTSQHRQPSAAALHQLALTPQGQESRGAESSWWAVPIQTPARY